MKIVTVLGALVLVGCAQGVQCDAGEPVLDTDADWVAATAAVGLTPADCPPANLLVVDDAQAEHYGMGKRGPKGYWGYTYVCDDSSLTLLREDGGYVRYHELLHAAIACSRHSHDGDVNHTLPVWEGVEGV